jgi:hypothetical protein
MKLENPTLLIVGDLEEGGIHESPFDQHPWTVHRVADCLQFLMQLFRLRPHVVLCGRDLPDGTWRDVAGVIATLYEPPALIVGARQPDEAMRAEVLALGHALLEIPCARGEAGRVLAEARQKAEGGRKCSCGGMAP